MWNKLMNNPLIGFLFGMLTTWLGFLGEPNAWFAIIVGAICVLGKELINNQMLGNIVNEKVTLLGLSGCLVTFLILLGL